MVHFFENGTKLKMTSEIYITSGAPAAFKNWWGQVYMLDVICPSLWLIIGRLDCLPWICGDQFPCPNTCRRHYTWIAVTFQTDLQSYNMLKKSPFNHRFLWYAVFGGPSWTEKLAEWTMIDRITDVTSARSILPKKVAKKVKKSPPWQTELGRVGNYSSPQLEYGKAI